MLSEMTRAMTRRVVLLAALAGATLTASPALAQNPQAQAPGIAVPVTGTAATGEIVNATFTIQRFVRSGSAINAVGKLTGTITDPATGAIRNFVTQVSAPLAANAITATCDILHLELGPLDLTLLGLNVHLDKVVLDITATPGAGNLLGNLLCSLAGLLDGGLGGVLGQLAGLLNQLLAILG
jgi:hypothetical protein